jgi:predicted N-acetyltransferase YhbS
MHTEAPPKLTIRSGFQIAPLRRADIPELSQFLFRGFRVPATSSFFSHEALSWKYFDGTSDSSADSTCSLIARSAGKIIGHVGMCPRQFIVSGEEGPSVSTMHAIDWLGSAAHPGAGVLLMLRAFKTSKTQYAAGASRKAQSLFPKLGFEKKSTVAIFRKVLAPTHRLRALGQDFFRNCAIGAWDMASVWRARNPPVPETVELRPAPAFTEEIDSLLRQSPLRLVTCQRDHLLLNYMLRYPLSGFSGWTIHASGRLIGFAVLKIAPQGRLKLGRIVDCWLDTEDPSCWQSAVASLIDRLRALSADDIQCYATTPSLRAALRRNGFAKWTQRNTYVRDKEQALPRNLPFGFSMLDADNAIL